MAQNDVLVQKLLERAGLLKGSDWQQKTEEEWRERAATLASMNLKIIERPLAELDAHLTVRSYILGHSLTKVDLQVWGVLRSNRVAHSYIKQGTMINLSRWFNYVEEANPWISSIVNETHVLKKQSASDSKGGSQAQPAADDGGSYDIYLPDADKGVVTRFPPEPSGYLHIGHAKAALLNDYFAHVKYPGGTLILRFDDTNPTKERQVYEDSIKVDLALMGIEPDTVTYTSDYFQKLHDYAIQLITDGHAYADDTPRTTIQEQRENKLPSANRDMPPSQSLLRFAEMETGSAEGIKWVIRAKISHDDLNGAMRDPVIYRCNLQAHHRTGQAWKVYPTYDFACPLVDSIEGVTHALRTTEYNDRDAQYQWMLGTLGLRHVHNWNFSRLSFVRTLLSKRKLSKLVESGMVGNFDDPSENDFGWADPRMPTLRGIRRRGMTMDALRDFILRQGPSKNVVNLDWFSFWATNKKYIDLTSPRFTAVETNDVCHVSVAGARAAPHTEEKPVHAKNTELGTKKVWYSGNVILDQADAKSFAQDEEVTLMNWGNAVVRSISHSLNPLQGLKTVTGLKMDLNLQGDVKKTSKKVTWLSTDQDLVPVKLVDFDYIITRDKLDKNDNLEEFLTPKTHFVTEALADCNVKKLKQGAIMQFDRKGFFRCDREFRHGEPAIFFKIPTSSADSRPKYQTEESLPTMQAGVQRATSQN